MNIRTYQEVVTSLDNEANAHIATLRRLSEAERNLAKASEEVVVQQGIVDVLQGDLECSKDRCNELDYRIDEARNSLRNLLTASSGVDIMFWLESIAKARQVLDLLGSPVAK